MAIAKSWIARPVESNRVISSAERRPSAAPRDHVPELGDVVPAHHAGLDRAGQLAARRGLLPLVAEQAAALQRGELHLGLSASVRAQHRQVLSRAQVGGEDHRLLRRASR